MSGKRAEQAIHSNHLASTVSIISSTGHIWFGDTTLNPTTTALLTYVELTVDTGNLQGSSRQGSLALTTAL